MAVVFLAPLLVALAGPASPAGGGHWASPDPGRPLGRPDPAGVTTDYALIDGQAGDPVAVGATSCTCVQPTMSAPASPTATS